MNTLIVGGIEGVHYTLVDGKHKPTDAATNYPWSGWAWSLQDNDSPAEYTEDPRNEKFGDNTKAKYDEFVDKVNKAGLDKVTEECKNQYMIYCESKK